MAHCILDPVNKLFLKIWPSGFLLLTSVHSFLFFIPPFSGFLWIEFVHFAVNINLLLTCFSYTGFILFLPHQFPGFSPENILFSLNFCLKTLLFSRIKILHTYMKKFCSQSCTCGAETIHRIAFLSRCGS